MFLLLLSLGLIRLPRLFIQKSSNQYFQKKKGIVNFIVQGKKRYLVTTHWYPNIVSIRKTIQDEKAQK
jgi:hypothetical protein